MGCEHSVYWALASCIMYVLGGALFVAGSVYVVPGIPVVCINFAQDCSFDVAIWYFIGCFFYLAAAILDLALQLVQCRRRGGWKSIQRKSMFRFDQASESLITAWIYLVGGILFFVGSVLFFPAFNAKIPARLTFRAGSVCYITGSSYGIIQLLYPSDDDDRGRDVRARTMTLVENISDDIGLPSLEDRLEKGLSLRRLSPLSSALRQAKRNMGGLRECCRRITPTVAVAIVVKVSFICGSSSFLIGGILFGENLFLEGGGLWLEGSILFLLGGLISLGSVVRGIRAKAVSHERLSLATSPSGTPSTDSTKVSSVHSTSSTSGSSSPLSSHDATTWVMDAPSLIVTADASPVASESAMTWVGGRDTTLPVSSDSSPVTSETMILPEARDFAAVAAEFQLA